MNGVQAWITVDNKVQLVEYQVDLDLSSNTATCWISGEPGQVCLPFIFCIEESRSPILPPFPSFNSWCAEALSLVCDPWFSLGFSFIQTDDPYVPLFQSLAIRWRELDDSTDISGFVMMDGYELGGRVLQANSHASAMFSRIATSPTSCLPLTFSSLPRSAGPWFLSHFITSLHFIKWYYRYWFRLENTWHDHAWHSSSPNRRGEAAWRAFYLLSTRWSLLLIFCHSIQLNRGYQSGEDRHIRFQISTYG